jgi:hypothetical protein
MKHINEKQLNVVIETLEDIAQAIYDAWLETGNSPDLADSLDRACAGISDSLNALRKIQVGTENEKTYSRND